MSILANQIVDTLRQVWQPHEGQFIPLHAPKFFGNEKKYLLDCIDSTYVSSVGSYVDSFESLLAEFTGSTYAIATVNGTSALHLSLILAGVLPGDEILMPSVSFIATANAVSYCGAFPHFVDVEESCLGIDPEALDTWLEEISLITEKGCMNKNTGRIIRAVIPVHIFGHPCLLDEIISISHKYNILVIEDAAEALGSLYKGKHVGNASHSASLSFNGNKIITTGGGGCVLTNDVNAAKLAKHLSTTAKRSHPWKYEHDQIGYNYRLPNINAALGVAQVEQLEKMIASKRDLYFAYKSSFSNLTDNEELRLMAEPPSCRSNYWLQSIVLPRNQSEAWNDILEVTNKMGFMTRPLWKPLHLQSPYLECPHAPVPVAESLATQIINIPSGVRE